MPLIVYAMYIFSLLKFKCINQVMQLFLKHALVTLRKGLVGPRGRPKHCLWGPSLQGKGKGSYYMHLQ